MSTRAKIIWTIVGLLALVWITNSPGDAADNVQGVLDWLKNSGLAIIEFIKNVFN